MVQREYISYLSYLHTEPRAHTASPQALTPGIRFLSFANKQIQNNSQQE